MELDALLIRWQQQQERADRRAALIASILAEIHRNRKKRPRAYTVEDFMPQRNGKAAPVKKAQTPEEQLAAIVAFNAALGGKDLRHLKG